MKIRWLVRGEDRRFDYDYDAAPNVGDVFCHYFYDDGAANYVPAYYEVLQRILVPHAETQDDEMLLIVTEVMWRRTEWGPEFS
jgi:hypothetical protein